MIIHTLVQERVTYCQFYLIVFKVVIRVSQRYVVTCQKLKSAYFKSWFIEVTFLNLQYKIQLTDTSVISFKTDNLLKTIGKLIFWYVFQTGTARNKTMSSLIFGI